MIGAAGENFSFRLQRASFLSVWTLPARDSSVYRRRPLLRTGVRKNRPSQIVRPQYPLWTPPPLPPYRGTLDYFGSTDLRTWTPMTPDQQEGIIMPPNDHTVMEHSRYGQQRLYRITRNVSAISRFGGFSHEFLNKKIADSGASDHRQRYYASICEHQ